MLSSGSHCQPTVLAPIACRLRYDNSKRNCFGFFADSSGDPFGSDQREDISAIGNNSLASFRVRPVSDEEGEGPAVVLQIHLAAKIRQVFPSNSSSSTPSPPILCLNGHFAGANGLKDGQMLILDPLAPDDVLTRKSVEILPMSSDDWDVVVRSAASVEELFLAQLRLIQPGMRFCLFLAGDNVATFTIGVDPNYSDYDKAVFLLTIGTQLLVAPPLTDKIMPKIEGQNGGKEVESGEVEDVEEDVGNIRSYLLPLGSHPYALRLLSDDFVQSAFPMCPHGSAQNPFFTRQHRISLLLNSLPYIFALQRVWMKREFGRGNDRRRRREWCVEVEDNIGAILVELPPSTGSAEAVGHAVDNILSPFNQFCEKLTAKLEGCLHSSGGLAHCWASPALRRALRHSHSALSWLRIRPILPYQLRLTNRISIASQLDNSEKIDKTFAQLVAASRELHTPWLFPRGQRELDLLLIERREGREEDEESTTRMIRMQIRSCEDEAKVDSDSGDHNGDESPPSSAAAVHRFIWPLSPELKHQLLATDDNQEYSLRTAAEDDDEEEDTEEMCKKVEPISYAPFSAQLELITSLAHSLIAFIRRCASRLDSKHCGYGTDEQQPMAFLLEGPIGSGKSKLLAMLADRISRSNRDQKPIFPIATKLIDCSSDGASSSSSFARLLDSTMSHLVSRWPSALLLDNFDAFAENVEVENNGSDGEQKVRKIYKNLFGVLFCDSDRRRVPIVCTVRSGIKLVEQMFQWEGQQLARGRHHRIRTLDKAEQLEVLQGLLGIERSREKLNGFAELNFGTIGELGRLVERVLFAVSDNSEKTLHSIIRDSISTASSICKWSEFGEGEQSIRFDQIVGMDAIKQRLVQVFIWPNKYPALFALSRMRIGHRAILHGPTGCGKSVLIRALANEMGINVISVRGPQLLSKYIGQSEQNVRELFTKIKLDALAPRRGNDSAHVTDRVVNQLLTELDGFEEDTEGICVIAATNRMDLIDRALLRPGRFDHKLFLGLPDLEQRLAMLRHYCTPLWGVNLSENVNLRLIAECTEDWSCAEVRAIVQNALWEAEREGEFIGEGNNEEKGTKRQKAKVCQRHLQNAAMEGGKRRKMVKGRREEGQQNQQRLTLG